MFYKLGFLLLLSLQIRSADCRKLQHTDEPVCTSRYDFEEKLLEKMVKLSHAFDVLEEKVAKLETKMDRYTEEQKRREQTGCPDGWVVFGGSCYSFHEKTMDFKAASDLCTFGGGTLVHIETGEENAFIQSLLRKVKGDAFWIGLTDGNEEGTWVYSGTNGRSEFFGWHLGEPNGGNSENCIIIGKNYDCQWLDVSCSRLVQPVCEIKKAG